MDLKKYFTDEEIKNLCGLQQLSIADYASKEKLNDGFGVRDYNTENHWRACDENFSLLDKKTILILPGSGTNSKKQANGMCKIAENMLPDDQKDKWQICSMHYEDSRIFHIPTVIRATELLDNYFAPLFSTQDIEGNLHNIDANKAAENMRNIIIFTHCYGGFIEKEIERKMSELMLDIGYTDKERDDIMKQMFVVQHNNIDEKLGQNKMFATHLLRLSAADEETDVSDMLYGSDYKPLINSYEMNYISRLISDLLYCILVDVTKGAYNLRPMFDEEIEELLDAVNNCIRQLEYKEHLLRTDYDEYVDCCDTIQTELERIKSLLENSPDTNDNQAFQDGFNAAVKKFCAKELQIAALDESEEKIEEELQKYIKKIPLKRLINMSPDEQFKEARKLMEETENK